MISFPLIVNTTFLIISLTTDTEQRKKESDMLVIEVKTTFLF